MQAEGRTGVEGSVVGAFRNVVDAERALGALREIGVPSDRVSIVMGMSASGAEDGAGVEKPPSEGRGTNVGGGAATGATLGAIVGILWGWISGSGVMEVPGTVASVSAGVLSATITGLAIGAAVGGLIGALVGVGMPEVEPPEDQGGSDGRILVTVQAEGAEAMQARDILAAHGASDLRAHGMAIARESVGAPLSEIQSVEEQPEEIEIAESQEVGIMADEGMGRDPNAVTGTRDDIDPETGTLGTGGTPMTTGYGVSGSTAGTGSEQGRTEQESDSFGGSTPDTDAYEKGGRGSTDSPGRDVEHDTPVAEKFGDVRADEAPVQSEPQTRDVYEQGPSYGTPTETEPVSPDTYAANLSRSSTDTTSSNVEAESTQESAGTNIPGTSDPRGLGDNTDES
ncbi:MAG TPA: hypothetical protein VJ183_17870 [Chloroflexia bacterium]|nr:hypothetical protein [Chloroflexia bacterium]